MAPKGIATSRHLSHSPKLIKPPGNLPPPTFELEAWANNYDGPLLPFRLAHVAIKCPSLSKAAIGMAIGKAKQGKDVQLYNRLIDIARDLGHSEEAKADANWASRKEEENRRELSRLESELRGYKNNLIRESIRMGQEDLATHLLLTGGPTPDAQSGAISGLSAAYQAYGKMRDYCTTPTHVNSMTLRLIFTSLIQAVNVQQAGGPSSMHLTTVLSNASRIRGSGAKEEEQSRLTPLSYVASGIAHLGLGDYSAAASNFLLTSFDYHNTGPVHGLDFGKYVASANDVAIYGGLCALATMTRERLNDFVLGGSFRAFLEQEPHMRKAISLYTTAKYQACIDTLKRYYSDWSLDVFLGANSTPGSSVNGSHVDRLFARIRERSITAHFSSFSQVSLTSLASTFPPISNAPNAMENEVLGMIQSGMLDARLDVVNGILIAPQKDPRRETHQDAKNAAEEVERTLLLRLHKVNMTLAGLEAPKPKGNNWDAMRSGNGLRAGPDGARSDKGLWPGSES